MSQIRSFAALVALFLCGNYAQAQAKEKEYTLILQGAPSHKAQADGRIAVLLPTTLPHQEVRFEVEGGDFEEVRQNGNTFLLISPMGADRSYKVTVNVKVKAFDYLAIVPSSKSVIPEDIKTYLKPSLRCDPKDVIELIKREKLEDPNPLVAAKKVNAWLSKNIEYRNDASSAFKSVREILDRKYAECTGFSACQTAMCRALGIPARQVSGVVSSSLGSEKILAYHEWAEIWVNGIWMPVEPQHPRLLGNIGPDYLHFASTDDTLSRETRPISLGWTMGRWLNENHIVRNARIER